MNFSGISNASLIGKLLRLPLRLMPSRMDVPVVQGPLKGMRWTVGSSNHGCWLGSYEYEKQLCVQRLVTPGAVAYDVGAHVGFYTLLLSKLVGPSGSVYAFEPFPRNLSFLQHHVAKNGLQNVRVIEAAVSDSSGAVQFEAGPTSSMGHISGKGDLTVRSEQLDDVVEQRRIAAPDFIKIDVEGAEVAVLRGASKLLNDARPVVLLATHGEDVHAECLRILDYHHYGVEMIGKSHDELLAIPK